MHAGFEEGIRGMKAGQQRRIIIPPALGPPVGPSTFFSAKQCEVSKAGMSCCGICYQLLQLGSQKQCLFLLATVQVFDIELLQIRTCERRQMAMFSDVVCT
jgi:hypothetical protein